MSRVLGVLSQCFFGLLFSGKYFLYFPEKIAFFFFFTECRNTNDLQFAADAVESRWVSIRRSVPQGCTWPNARADMTTSSHAWLVQLGRLRPGDVPLALCHRRSWAEQPGSQTRADTLSSPRQAHSAMHKRAKTHTHTQWRAEMWRKLGYWAE